MNTRRPDAGRGTQRDPLPFFAGRRTELGALNERLDRLCETGDPSGGTSLIIGVPSAGKTHLGRMFAEEATRRSQSKRVVHIKLNTQTLKAPDTVVFMNCMAALGSEKVGRQVANIEDKTATNGASIVGVSATVTRDRVRLSTDLTTLLRESFRAGAWGKLNRESLRMREAVGALDDANYDGAATVREAIAHGVLTADDEGALSFGIPSFHRHMARRLELHQPSA